MFCQNCGTERVGEAPFCSGCGTSFDGTQAPGAPRQSSGAAGLLFKDLFATISGCFTAPATTMSDLSKGGNFKIALGLMASQSLATLLAFLFLLLFISSQGGGDVLKYVDFPGVAIGMLCLIVPFGLATLFAAVLLLVNNVFFRGKNTYKEMLCVASGSSAAIAIGLCTASVLGFLVGVMNVQFGVYMVGFLMSVGTILSYFLVGAGLKGVGEPNDNKRLWILLCSFAIMLICNILIMTKIVFPTVIPDVGGTIANYISNLLYGLAG